MLQTYSSTKVLDQSQNVIIHQPKISKAFGRCAAMVLQQINYWSQNINSGRIHEGKKWIYNTYKELGAQLNFSEASIKRAIKKLKGSKVLLVKRFNSSKGDQTNSYYIDHVKLFEYLEKQNKNDDEGDHQSIKDLECQDNKVNLTFSTGLNDLLITNTTSNTFSLSLEISEKKINQEEPTKIFESLIVPSNEKQPTTTHRKNKIENKEEFQKTTQELLKIWNKEVEGEGRIISLTPKRAKFFMAAFIKMFDRSIEKWKKFCQLITKSDWLMGRLKNGFRASVDWFLKFDVIQRILEGDFGLLSFIGDLDDQKTIPETVKQDIITSTENQEIKKAQIRILNLVGTDSYISWFKGGVWEITSCGIQLATDNPFKCDYLQNRFGNILHTLSVTVCFKKG